MSLPSAKCTVTVVTLLLAPCEFLIPYVNVHDLLSVALPVAVKEPSVFIETVPQLPFKTLVISTVNFRFPGSLSFANTPGLEDLNRPATLLENVSALATGGPLGEPTDKLTVAVLVVPPLPLYVKESVPLNPSFGV